MAEHQPKSVTEKLMNKAAHLQEKVTNLSERLTALRKHLVVGQQIEGDISGELYF